MVYKICHSEQRREELGEASGFTEIELSDRAEVKRYIEAHEHELQRFSIPETGSIFVWAVELGQNGKPAAALYFHKVAQFIWIDFN